MSVLAALGIASAAGAAAKMGAGMYGASQQFTRDDRQRLKELERKKALNQLGMTAEEEGRLQRQLLSPITTAQREGQQQLMESLAIEDVSAATPVRQIAALEAEAGKQRAQAMEKVQEADRLRIAQQQEEINALKAQQKARRVGMATAGLSGAADFATVAAQHAQARQQAANQEAMMQMLQAQQQSEQQSSAFLSDATAQQLMMLQILKQ